MSSGYATIVYEPYQNGRLATPGAFQRHNVRAGKIWATRAVVGAVGGECSQASPCTMTRFMELNADAVVQTVKLRIGQNSGLGWDGWVGYADDVRLGLRRRLRGLPRHDEHDRVGHRRALGDQQQAGDATRTPRRTTRARGPPSAARRHGQPARNVATASAATPSPRPTKPMPSPVEALTLT